MIIILPSPLTPCADLVFGFSRPSYSFSESDGSASGLMVISTGANIGEFSIQIFAGTDDDNALATANGKNNILSYRVEP